MARRKKDGEGEEEGGAPLNALADRILEDHTLMADKFGTVYVHQVNHWREITPIELQQLALFKQGADSSRARHRTEIVDYIKVYCCDPDLKWGRVADYEAPCANVVVDVRDGSTRPHDPDDYLDRALPISFRPEAACEVWKSTLASWFGRADSERALRLQEFFGYVILPHARFKKALICKGPSDCGKSLVPYVASLLVGKDATCTLPIDMMEDPVMCAVLKGKAVNILSELPADAMIKDGGFKTLVSTEEPIMIKQLYTPAEPYTPTAKHIIATNNLPRINDRTEATINRFLIIPFDRIFAEKEQDRELQAKLAAELEGILCWAIEGARRLIERRGVFLQPPEALPVLAELREEANPIMVFLAEQCFLNDNNAVPLATLTGRYNKWQGTRQTTPKQLGKMLRAAGRVVKDVRVGEKKSRVLKSLVGYELVEETTVPEQLVVDPAAAASLEPEIKGSIFGKA